MHPRIEEVFAHLDKQRAALQSAVADVPAALRTRRPGKDRWSVAEVLEHLTLVESRIAKMLADRLAAARATGIGPETDESPVVPTIDVGRLLDRSTPITASEAALPGGDQAPDLSWDALTKQRAGLLATIREADGLALGDVTIPHARLGNLNVYQWLVFLGAHEGRHALQIREAASELPAE
jgi:hypothetical protein